MQKSIIITIRSFVIYNKDQNLSGIILFQQELYYIKLKIYPSLQSASPDLLRQCQKWESYNTLAIERFLRDTFKNKALGTL